MRETVVASTILVAVLTGGVFAGVLQNQLTAIDAFYDLGFINGNGDRTGQGLRNLIVDNQQNVVGTASESLLASVGQAVDATANGGVLIVLTSIGLRGHQAQSIGDDLEPRAQGESLTVDFGQVATRIDSGAGVTNGLYTVALEADQNGGNAGGTLGESMTLMSLQTLNTTSSPGASGQVTIRAGVSNTQTQGSP